MGGERKTDLKEVLFEVQKRPLYSRRDKKDTAEGNGKAEYHKVPRFEAVVDVERDHTFAVVSENYRLVKNGEALGLGEQCFQEVFTGATSDDMTVFNIIQPVTRSFCHVDFIHEKYTLEPWDGDKWWPYLRVTNSYNRTKPLRFDLGFCRAICTNGVIFGREHIELRYYHTHDQIAGEGRFKVAPGRLQKLEIQFIERMHNLKRFYVSPEHMLALACKAFGIKVTEGDLRKPRRREQLLEFRTRIETLAAGYCETLGPNGYAALNVLSDYARSPNLYISNESMVDPLQKKCGDWSVSFLQAIQDPAFDVTKYLGAFVESASYLQSDALAAG